MTMTVRNADLADLVKVLESSQALKLDAVVSPNKIWADEGIIHVQGIGWRAPDNLANLDFVSVADFLPTAHMDSQIADKLGIPLPYVRKLRDEHIDLYDKNVNGWLSRLTKPLLVRGFANMDDDGPGVGRALLSDSFAPIENLDYLVAGLEGMRRAETKGHQLTVKSTMVTDTKMVLKVTCPTLTAQAPNLLMHYRPPRNVRADGPDWGYGGVTDLAVEAGFTLGNSEVGAGKAFVVPEFSCRICNNGMRMTADIQAKVHLGSKLPAGLIHWSNETMTRNLELVTSMAADAVESFLSQEYLDAKIAEIDEKAGKEISKPDEVIKTISMKLAFPDSARQLIFDHFIQGGQMTAGGVLNAVTSAAQVVENGDLAFDMENKALAALELAAA